MTLHLPPSVPLPLALMLILVKKISDENKFWPNLAEKFWPPLLGMLRSKQGLGQQPGKGRI